MVIENARRDSMLRKVRALLATADEASGASEAERFTAINKAHELMERFQIDLTDLELREEGLRQVEFTIDDHDIMRMLGRAVGKYTDCKVWTNIRLRKLYLYGLASDAIFAEWLLKHLTGYCQRATLDFLLEGRSQFESQSFRIGMVTRLIERLRDAKESSEGLLAIGGGKSLVLRKDAIVNAAFAGLGIRLESHTVQKPIFDYDIALRGRDAAEGAAFDRPLQAPEAPAMIGKGKP